MSLINCPECNRPVLDTASSCPGCEAPITGLKETQAAGVQSTTTRETGKKLKGRILMPVIVMMLGGTMMFSNLDKPGSRVSSTGIIIFFIGLVWLLVTKFRVWWHHK
jgi:hypothetical protein